MISDKQIADASRDMKANALRIARIKTWARAAELAKTMQCRCDLDNWEPELTTGHSWVCPIHKAVMKGGA